MKIFSTEKLLWTKFISLPPQPFTKIRSQSLIQWSWNICNMFLQDGGCCGHCADDTQICFKLDSKDQCVSKLNNVLNAVQSWMFKIKLNLNKDKTNLMVVGNPLQLWNIDLPSNLKLDQTDINLSTKLKNLGVVFDENLTLKY